MELADASAAREAAETQVATLESSLTTLGDDLAAAIAAQEKVEADLGRRQEEINRLQAGRIRYADQLAALESDLQSTTEDGERRAERLLAEFSLVSQLQNQTADRWKKPKDASPLSKQCVDPLRKNAMP